MNAADQTSLDRYLMNNGHRLLGMPTTQAGVKFQIIFGAFFAVISLLVMPFSILYGWPLLVAMLGPMTAGVVNLAVGLSLQRKMSRSPAMHSVKLSPEARALLAGTLKQMGGWRAAWAQQSSTWQEQSQWAHPAASNTWGANQQASLRSSKEVLNERAYVLLEDAARECNRIQACIAGGNNQAVQRRAMDLAAAADEGMAQVLQQASLLDRFPESGPTVEASARNQIESLREIAERLEALHVREPLLTERMGSSSTVDRVLDDLRLESLARQELSSEGQGSEEKHQA